MTSGHEAATRSKSSIASFAYQAQIYIEMAELAIMNVSEVLALMSSLLIV